MYKFTDCETVCHARRTQQKMHFFFFRGTIMCITRETNIQSEANRLSIRIITVRFEVTLTNASICFDGLAGLHDVQMPTKHHQFAMTMNNVRVSSSFISDEWNRLILFECYEFGFAENRKSAELSLCTTLLMAATWCSVTFAFNFRWKIRTLWKVQPSERTNKILLTEFEMLQRVCWPCFVYDKHVCEHAFATILLCVANSPARRAMFLTLTIYLSHRRNVENSPSISDSSGQTATNTSRRWYCRMRWHTCLHTSTYVSALIAKRSEHFMLNNHVSLSLANLEDFLSVWDWDAVWTLVNCVQQFSSC